MNTKNSLESEILKL